MRAETEKRVLEEVSQEDNQRQLPAVKRTCLGGGDQVRTTNSGGGHKDAGTKGA